MASNYLTDKIVKNLPPPVSGVHIEWDTGVRGFGVRILPSGVRTFILADRIGGRQRQVTIGRAGVWTVAQARDRAKAIKREFDDGVDVVAQRRAEREAPDMNALADRFVEEYLPKKRAATRRSYEGLLKLYVRPKLGALKVAEVEHRHVETLHASVAKGRPYQANRCAALLSRMFNLAIKWGWCSANPAKGIERVPEQKRERWLKPETEVKALHAALDKHPERISACAIRFLLLTGARKGEALAMKWEDYDPKAGEWQKPAHTTKTAKTHTVPLSEPARELLAAMWKARPANSPYVFHNGAGGHLMNVRKCWAAVCAEAGIEGARIHDTRHSFASALASAGLNLQVIGQLLGHTQISTTQRYAHLSPDAQRAAAETAGKILTNVVPISAGRRKKA
jgi:integrase